VAHHDHRAPVAPQRLGELTGRGHVQVVGRLVEDQELGRRLREQQGGEHGTESLAVRQPARHLVRAGAAEQEPREPGAHLVRRGGGGLRVDVLRDGE
jgi:hypothetical protein